MHKEKQKKVVITGGSGFLGSHLSEYLITKGYHVVSLDIAPPKHEDVSFVQANLLEEVPADSKLRNPYAVINLAGKNIFGRWTDDFKRLVYETRVVGTENLVRLFADEQFRPAVFVSASAVGYYGDCREERLTHESKAGEGFLATVSKDWEEAAKEASVHGISTVIVRNGHILGEGGLLATLLPFYRWGLGGPLGSGQQWFPWIHIEDIVRMYISAMESEDISVLNAVAPDQIRNEEFSRQLADVLGRPHIFRIPQWALQMLYGQFGEEMTYSQRVTARAADMLDFSYRFPALQGALEDIVQ